MYTLYFIKKMQGRPFLWGFFSPESESVDIIFHVLYSMKGATTKQKPTVAPFTNGEFSKRARLKSKSRGSKPMVALNGKSLFRLTKIHVCGPHHRLTELECLRVEESKLD